MPTPRVLLMLALVGCNPGPDASDSKDLDPPETDAAGDTEVDTEVTDSAQPPGYPTLCAEVQREPEWHTDLSAWAEYLFESNNPFMGTIRSNGLEAMGETDLGTTDAEIIDNRIERAWHRLRHNDVDGAIADLDAALALIESVGSNQRGRARNLLAIAWMRRAELDNCLASGSGDACLVPFSEEAQHQLTDGMNNAAALLQTYLTEDRPEHIVPAWLLNVTQMALGTYPDAVPEQWRVPEESLRSEMPEYKWENLTHVLSPHGGGLLTPTLAGGAAIDDFNGDGRLDILTSSMHPEDGMILMLNTGDGFCEASHAAGVSRITGILSFTHADYDNDGDLDVIAPRGAWMDLQGRVRPSLLRNDGEGRFTDVAEEAGITNYLGPTQTAAWGDVDLDGDLDLFIGRESLGPFATARSSLYINQGDGTFEDRGRPMGVSNPGYVKGAAFADVDNDGDQDLFVSTFGGPNRLYIQGDDGYFEEKGRAANVLEPTRGFAAWFTDHDNDGWLDIFVASYPATPGGLNWLSTDYGRSAEPYAMDVFDLPNDYESAQLHLNNGEGGFDNITEEMGLDDVHATMGANSGDMNADGFPDVYLGTGAPSYDALEPNVAYFNLGGERYVDVTSDAHVGHLQKGHAVSFGDFDEDGDEDLLAQIGGAFPGDRFPDALFQNPRQGVNAITLRLEGVQCNRSAIGARVRVVTPTQTFHHLVGPGGSFGANSLQVEAALGEITEVVRVEIDWPGGSTEVIDGITPGSVYKIRQGDGIVDQWVFRRMAFPQPGEEHHDTDTP